MQLKNRPIANVLRRNAQLIVIACAYGSDGVPIVNVTASSASQFRWRKTLDDEMQGAATETDDSWITHYN